ncbi:hypothetical protein GCM10009719_17110 [Nocardioides kribbensis]
MRVCAEPGCPVLGDKTRCAEHRREREQARGNAAARGYGADHRRLRAGYQRRMDAGERFTCWRCAAEGRPHEVDPRAWHLGHDDHDRSIYRGPECATGNLSAAGRISPRG